MKKATEFDYDNEYRCAEHEHDFEIGWSDCTNALALGNVAREIKFIAPEPSIAINGNP